MSTPTPPNRLSRQLAGWVTRPSFWAVLVILVIGMPASAFFLMSRSAEPLDDFGAVPAFSLTRQDAKPFGQEALTGKVWIANFIFTRCPTVCPKFTAKMAQVQRQTEMFGTDLQLVSFSVDPAYDTPERLAAYAKKYGADETRWSFLTGEDEALKKTVVEGFKISMGKDPEVDDDVFSIFHGEHFVLVDQVGKIRGYYSSSDPEAVERLVREAVALATP